MHHATEHHAEPTPTRTPHTVSLNAPRPTIAEEAETFQVRIFDAPYKGTSHVEAVEGHRVVIPGFEDIQMFVHRSVGWNKDSYTVSEVSTGCRIYGHDESMEDTVNAVPAYLKRMKSDQADLKRRIAQAIARYVEGHQNVTTA